MRQAVRDLLARLALSPYISGPVARCPYCQSHRLKKLIEKDRIDPFASTFWSRLERLRGGGIYHCAFCRVQFFDTRPTFGASSGYGRHISPPVRVKAIGRR